MAIEFDYSPVRMADRAEIQDVMFRWCRAVDRCDWSLIRDVFHPDGFDNHGIYQGGVDGLIAWLSERHKSIASSMHCVSNILIEFANDDNALAESYSIVIQRYPGGGAQGTRSAITGGKDAGDGDFDMVMSGRYVDHFHRRDGRWKILKRTVVFDNSIMLPRPGEDATLGPDWAVSTRDTTDPIFALRRSIGLA